MDGALEELYRVAKHKLLQEKNVPVPLSTNLMWTDLRWNPVLGCGTHSSNLLINFCSYLTENAVSVHYKDQQVQCL